MSKIKINNTAKPITCMNYKFGYGGSAPGHIGTIVYRDCSGIEKTLNMTYDESDGRYYNITICARNIIEFNSYVIDEGSIGSCSGAILPINGTSYDVTIRNYECIGRGDGPTNFTVYCEGGTAFSIAALTGVTTGRIKLITPNDNPDTALSIITNTIHPITQTINVEILKMETGNPGEYPYGNIPYEPVVYTFQHTNDNGATWGTFNVIIRKG